jgi:hypothetical protein
VVQALGLDAVSSYAADGQYAGNMWPYTQLTEHVGKLYWNACLRDRIPTVAFVTAGWDTRPRIEHSVSWIPWIKAQPDPTPPAEQEPLIDAVTASPKQLARHLQDAIDWTRKNRDLNPANAVIIYAWNENDEGGWLIPTLSEGTGRLDAIRDVLKGNSANASLTQPARQAADIPDAPSP